jgi:hypothetical protein
MLNAQTNPDGPALMIPSREDIESLKVGDLAPDCFGRMSEITEIFAQKDDITGRAFVCYYTAFGASGILLAQHEGGRATPHGGHQQCLHLCRARRDRAQGQPGAHPGAGRLTAASTPPAAAR